MYYYTKPAYLGADETKPGAPFVRLVNPSELDKVALEMSRLIKSYYAGFDIVNPALWRKLGFDVGSQGNPVQEFLQSYIQVARETRTHLSEANKEWWIDALHTRFNIRKDDLSDYIRAMLDMIRANTMSDTILKPYDYTPTEIGEDIAKGVFPKFVFAAAVIGGSLVLANTLIPQVTKSIAGARRRKR